MVFAEVALLEFADCIFGLQFGCLCGCWLVLCGFMVGVGCYVRVFIAVLVCGFDVFAIVVGLLVKVNSVGTLYSLILFCVGLLLYRCGC